MKRKFILSIVLTSVLVCGCKNKGENSSSEFKNPISSSEVTSSSSSFVEEVVLPVEAVDFILFVNEIVIDEYAGIAIEEAWNMYDSLDPEGDFWGNTQLLEAYYKLIYLEEKYNEYIEIYYEALEFIEKVDSIPYLLNLDDEIYIIEALEAYGDLSEEAKEIIGVSDAYKRLENAKNSFDALYDELLEEERQSRIDVFLKIVNALPSLEEFKVSNIEELNSALDAYKNLDEDIIEDSLVVEAYNRLLELQTRYEELINIKIYLDANEGSCDVEYIEMTALEEVGTLPTPTRNNYKFLGWYTALEGGKQVTSSTVFEESTTIYARWQEILNLTIILDANGGECSETSRNITNEEEVGTLPTPTRANHRFLGWYTALEGGELVTSSTVFEDSTTIYARWKEILNLTIILDANGGECRETSINITNEEEIGTLPTPTFEGYRFLGWYTALEGGKQVTSSTVFEESTTIYARWEDENIVHSLPLEDAYLDTYMDNHAKVLWKSSSLGNVNNKMTFTVTITFNGQEYKGRTIDWLNNWGAGAAYSGIGFYRENCPVNLQKDEYSVTVSYDDGNGVIYSCTVHHPAQ